jgi:glycopeptide antibiotics resistance protein
MADGVITISDVPTILVVLLKSETFVETLKNTANQTNVSSVPFSKIMKYCSMGLFYYFMLNNNTNEDDLTSFLFTYPALWSLVELQLPSMDNTSETTSVTATTVQSKTTVKRCC